MQAITMVDRVCLGQVFTDDGKAITVHKCWMVICNTEQGYPEYSIFPLMPTRKERAQAITISMAHAFDSEFLDRHNEVFDVFDTTLQSFLAEMPEFNKEAKLEDVFKNISASVTGLAPNGDSVGEPFGRHLYLATAPISEEEKEEGIIFLEFDDNTYRPETRVAPLGGCHHAATYHDFVETSRSWQLLSPNIAEEIFQKVDDQAINALNSGLNSLKRIGQQTLGTEKVEEYNLINHLEELVIVPTIWRFGEATEVYHDLWAPWQTDVNSGDIYANLREIQLRHKVNTLGAGLIAQRKAPSTSSLAV